MLIRRSQKIAPTCLGLPLSLFLDFHVRVVQYKSIIVFVSLTYEHASYEVVLLFRVIVVIRKHVKLVVPVRTETTTTAYYEYIGCGFCGCNFIVVQQCSEVDEDHATAAFSSLLPIFLPLVAKGGVCARDYVLSQSSSNMITGMIVTCMCKVMSCSTWHIWHQVYINRTGMIFTAHEQRFASVLVVNGQQWMNYASTTVYTYLKCPCSYICSRVGVFHYFHFFLGLHVCPQVATLHRWQ